MSQIQESNPLSGMVAASSAGVADSGIEKVLNVVRTHLGMDVAFVSQFRVDDRVFTHVDARERSPIKPGDKALLKDGYCQRVVDGRLPQLIPNAQELPATAALPETQAIPIGAHISVPIRLSDGRVYGTFCCFSFLPDVTLTERDLQMMRAFADMVADQIDREMQAASERDECVARINRALELDEPGIVFQPIYDLDSRACDTSSASSRTS